MVVLLLCQRAAFTKNVLNEMALAQDLASKQKVSACQYEKCSLSFEKRIFFNEMLRE
jgi:hypothetical protein